MDKITLINTQGRIKIIPLALFKMMPAHKYGLQPHAVKETPQAVIENIKKEKPGKRRESLEPETE